MTASKVNLNNFSINKNLIILNSKKSLLWIKNIDLLLKKYSKINDHFNVKISLEFWRSCWYNKRKRRKGNSWKVIILMKIFIIIIKNNY